LLVRLISQPICTPNANCRGDVDGAKYERQTRDHNLN
jgi:hypothetical protein